MRIESDIVKTACVVALLCGVYGGVVIWPSGKQNKAMAATIQSKQDQLAQHQVPDLSPLRSEIAQLRAELRDNAVDLPQGDSPFRVLDNLTDAITSNNVTVYDTALRRPDKFARFSVTPVDVTFKSGFDRAFDVLRTIETSDQPVRIERLEFSGSPDDTFGAVDVSLQMSSFYLPLEQEGARR